ncbi:hypothetical protein UFOVP61_50 [uncultured Caudovirales phage]|uniref:Ubiquitin-activating enzyme E1, FCCH domain containing protein n=1 Tax=uncultured Caudovirales phage TaxID=2100421 RepID=A0A6J5KUW6_9CAUD|nr:hypothetical protein UFOVP61_50 [uncultured Caudovirales phage]
MNIKTLLRSFAGGEITPEMFGRIDLPKNQTGLQKCLNFVVLPHGPVARRPGTAWLNECRDSTTVSRLIPFVYSSTQAIQLEVGVGYIRFHNGSGTLLEANATVTSVIGNTITQTAHGYTTGNWVFLSVSGAGGRFFKITVTGANTYTTADPGGTAVNPNVLYNRAARVYQIATTYDATNIFDLHYAQSADVLTLSHPSVVTKELRRLGATNWTLTDASFTPTILAPTGPTATPTVATATSLTTARYVVTSLAADLVTESVASAEATCSNNLTLAGNFNTISWTAATGANRYYVYKQRGGTFGYIGQTTGLSLVDENVTPDTIQVPPENNITLNTGAGEYPAAVTYHEQRRWFAGPTNHAQSIYATRSATDANMTSSVPTRDDDALQFRIASSQQNAVRHLVSLSDLLALTAGGEFRIFSDGSASAITPKSITIKPQAYCGANNVQPVVTSGSALYVQSQGSHVREIAYNPAGTGAYSTVDISMMAPHLFNGYSIVQLAYCRAPDQIAWAVRSDGVLLGLTYVPDQQVFAWHQHVTDGFVESVSVIPENNTDVLYMIVRRTVAGRTVRYIEVLSSRLFTTLASCFYVDAGASYSGSPVTTLSGLWHLEGKTVSILADGAVQAPAVVANGAITLVAAASVINVGLAYSSDLQTLPLDVEGAPAGGMGTVKNVNKVHIRVAQSSLVSAGPTFAKLTAFPSRAVSDPYGSPPALRNNELPLVISPSWGSDASICLRTSDPTPLTITSMTLEVAVGG